MKTGPEKKHTIEDTAREIVGKANITPESQNVIIRLSKAYIKTFIAFGVIFLVLFISAVGFIAYKSFDMWSDAKAQEQRIEQEQQEFIEEYNETKARIEEGRQQIEESWGQ